MLSSCTLSTVVIDSEQICLDLLKMWRLLGAIHASLTFPPAWPAILSLVCVCVCVHVCIFSFPYIWAVCACILPGLRFHSALYLEILFAVANLAEVASFPLLGKKFHFVSSGQCIHFTVVRHLVFLGFCCPREYCCEYCVCLVVALQKSFRVGAGAVGALLNSCGSGQIRRSGGRGSARKSKIRGLLWCWVVVTRWRWREGRRAGFGL